MSDETLRLLERAAVASPDDPAAALLYVRALARLKGPSRCDWEGCDLPGRDLAAGREYGSNPGHPVGLYCGDHASRVADEGHPEYTVSCPLCGCSAGVN